MCLCYWQKPKCNTYFSRLLLCLSLSLLADIPCIASAPFLCVELLITTLHLTAWHTHAHTVSTTASCHFTHHKHLIISFIVRAGEYTNTFMQNTHNHTNTRALTSTTLKHTYTQKCISVVILWHRVGHVITLFLSYTHTHRHTKRTPVSAVTALGWENQEATTDRRNLPTCCFNITFTEKTHIHTKIENIH